MGSSSSKRLVRSARRHLQVKTAAAKDNLILNLRRQLAEAMATIVLLQRSGETETLAGLGIRNAPPLRQTRSQLLGGVIDDEADASAGLGALAGCASAQAERNVELFNIFDAEDVSPESFVEVQSACASGLQAVLVQTDLSLQDHAKSCAVSTYPCDAILVGLCALGAERLEAHRACIAKIGEIINAPCDARTSWISPSYEDVEPVPLDKECVARDSGALVDALDKYRRQVALLFGAVDDDRGDDVAKVASKVARRRVKRDRKRIEAKMMKLNGKGIIEARASAKAISLEELHAMEKQLLLRNRGPMRPSRRRRRLAWVL